MRLARHKNRKSSRLQYDRLLIGNLAAQLIVVLNMHLIALASRIGHPEQNAFFAGQQHLNINVLLMQFRFLLLWALRRKLQDIHKNSLALQRVAPWGLLLRSRRKGKR